MGTASRECIPGLELAPDGRKSGQRGALDRFFVFRGPAAEFRMMADPGINGLDLAPWFNNVGVTSESSRQHGDFDGFGRSFALESLRYSSELPRALIPGCPGDGSPDNIACQAQKIHFPKARTMTRLWILGASEGGGFVEPIQVVDLGIKIPVRLSDWIAPQPRFGETCGALAEHVHEHSGSLEQGPRARIWCTAIDVPLDGAPCRGLILPFNPSMHIFALATE